jgi:hypothetical protein
MKDRPSIDRLRRRIREGIEAHKSEREKKEGTAEYDSAEFSEEVFPGLPDGAGEFAPGQPYKENGVEKRKRSHEDVDGEVDT